MSNIQTQLLALYPINDQPISMATYLRHALHHLRSSGVSVSVQQECDLRNLRNLHNSKNATTSFRDMVVAVEGVMKDSLTDGAISALASANVFTLPTPIPMDRVTMLQDGLDRIERSVEALAQRLDVKVKDADYTARAFELGEMYHDQLLAELQKLDTVIEVSDYASSEDIRSAILAAEFEER